MSASPITLIRPPLVFSRSTFSAPVTPPLALAYLAAALERESFPVTCIDAIGEAIRQIHEDLSLDCFTRGLTIEQIVDRIPADTQFIAVSCMFSQEWLKARQLLVAVREAHPDAVIVIGGEHATAAPEYLLGDCSAIDAVSLGEGEEAIVDLVRGFSTDPAAIPGLVYRDGDTIRRTDARRRIARPEELARPAWHLLPIRQYHEAGACCGINTGVSMPILATRGCPFTCTFCSNPLMWTPRYTARPAADVISEIIGYIEEYGATNIEFYDLTAIVRKDWILEFCRLYKEHGLTVDWTLPSGSRSEALDDEVLEQLATTNCRYLVYAPESGSAKTLSEVKKKISLPKMLASIRSAKRLGMKLRCNLLIGLPSEGRWDIMQTVLFQWRLALIGVDDLPLYMFSPYPGSELFQQLIDSGVIRDLDEDYFKSLLQQTDFKRCRSYNQRISGFELAACRLFGMAVAYLISYLRSPLKLGRTLTNIFIRRSSETVFEQRLIERRRNLKDVVRS